MFCFLVFQIGTYCGHTNPSNVISMNNEMYMQFVTDSDGPSTGFIVEFKMIESPCGVQNITLNESKRSIEIVSPMIGDHYMADINCLWTINVDEEDIIDVKFDRFDLEGDTQNKCEADYLEITDELVKSPPFFHFINIINIKLLFLFIKIPVKVIHPRRSRSEYNICRK